MAKEKLSGREKERLISQGIIDEDENVIGDVDDLSPSNRRFLEARGMIDSEGKSTGGDSVTGLLMKALDLTEKQYEENKAAIDKMIETGVPAIEAAGARADFANVLELINMVRENRKLPKVEAEEWASSYVSAAAKAGADPESIAAQKRALSELSNRITPALTDAERAIIEVNRRGQEQDLRGARGAALSSARARGFGGAGMEFQAGLAAQQEGSERRMLEDLAASGMAIDRSERALRDFGGLAGDIREQSFKEEFETGSALDKAEEFRLGMLKDYEIHRTKTLAQENRDKWGRQTDISDRTFGAIADRYGHETAPVYFESDLVKSKAGIGSEGTGQMVSALGALAGTKASQDAIDQLSMEEDDGLFGIGMLGL
jgi:hypothetical protein